MSKNITIAEALDLAIQNTPRSTSLSLLADELGVPYEPFRDRPDGKFLEDDLDVFCERPFDEWVCWDTPVGKSVVYLNNNPVAITVMPCRKCNTDVYWLGEEAMQSVRQRLIDEIDWAEQGSKPMFVSRETKIPLEGDDIGDSRSAYAYQRRK